MNDDVMGGMWKQIRGNVKSAFGRLTDDDITEAEGNADKMMRHVSRDSRPIWRTGAPW